MSSIDGHVGLHQFLELRTPFIDGDMQTNDQSSLQIMIPIFAPSPPAVPLKHLHAAEQLNYIVL